MTGPWILCLTLVLVGLLSPALARGDTRTTDGNSSGEGAGPFAGVLSSPTANLFSGAMGTSIPIQVPPGRKNLTPDLKLVYSSDSGQSPFGFGWDLPLGRIERNTKYGAPSCALNTDEFVLSLNGSAVELLRVGNLADNAYRAKIDEAYLEAKAFPESNRWEVYDRAGNMYLFGTTGGDRAFTNSETTFLSAGPPCAFTSIWVLNRIEDPNGNRIDIVYFKDENVFYPSMISYGGNENLLGGKHPFRVEFRRRATPRPHPGTSYRRGVRESARYVIDQITVRTSVDGVSFPDPALRTITLAHEEVPENGRTLLSSVAATLLPTRTFEYSTSLFRHAAATAPTVEPSGDLPILRSTDTGTYDVHKQTRSVMDMNGDGFQDLVYSENSSSWTVMLGSESGFRAVQWRVPPGLTGAYIRYTIVSTGRTTIDTTDLDGDGIVDLIDANIHGGSCSGGWWVRRGREFQEGEYEFSDTAECWTGAGEYSGVVVPVLTSEGWGAGTHFYTTRELVDINGDGRPDIVDGPAGGAGDWTVRINASGDSCASGGHCFALDPSFVAAGPIRDTYSPSFSGYTAARINIVDLIDINGDGLLDRVSTQARSGRPDFDFERINWAGQPVPPAIPAGAIFCNTQNWFQIACMLPPPAGLGFAGIAYVELGTGRGMEPGDQQSMKAGQHPSVPFVAFLGTRTQLLVGIGSQTWTTLEDFVDLNGDGLAERLWFGVSASSINVQFNRGGSLGPLALEPVPPFHIAPPQAWSGLSGTSREAEGLASTRDLVDINGDGFVDQVAANGSTWTVQRGGPIDGEPNAPPSMLVKIDDGTGGITQVEYEPSTVNGSNPHLPFVKWVVARIRQTDGLCTAPQGIEFGTSNPCVAQGHEIQKFLTYDGGRFDGATREFRGFETVTEIDTQGSKRIITFSQDDATRGKVVSEVVETSANVEVKRAEYVWDSQQASDGRTQIFLSESQVVESALGASGASDWCVVNRNDAPDQYGRVSRSCTLDCESAEGFQGCGATPVVGEVLTETTWANPANPAGDLRVRERPWRIKISYGDNGGTARILSDKRFAYDGLAFDQPITKGNLTTTESALDQSYASAVPPTSKTEYDSYGNVTEAKDPNAVAFNYGATVSDFDAWELYPVSVTRPSTGGISLTTTSQWDRGVGRPTLIEDPNGQQKTFRYDALGRVLCEAKHGEDCSTSLTSARYRYEYATPGAATFEGKLSYVEVKTREPNAPDGYLVSRRYFDALGRPRFVTSQTVIGSNSNLQEVVDAQTDYSRVGNPTRVFDRYLKSGAVVASPVGVASTTFSYVLNDSTTVVDPLGRVHETTPPDGRSTRTFYEGTRVRTLDADDNAVAITRNHLGHETLEQRTGADSTSMRFEREFDGMGRLLRAETSNTASTVVTHAYDTLGRLRQTVDPDSGTWKYGYDPSGNLVFRDDPKTNQHLAWAFDELGRVKRRCALAGDTFGSGCPADSAGIESIFEYDSSPGSSFGLGRLTGVSELPVGGQVENSEELTYDIRGRVDISSKTIKNKTLVIGFDYDVTDRPTTILYPSGQAAGEAVVHTYDPAGRLKSVVGARTYASSIHYDLRGRVSHLTHGNGVADWSEFYGPEENHRLREVHSVNASTGQHVLRDLEYLYDDVGRVDEIRDHNDTTYPALSNDAIYGYDGLGRLRSVNWAGIPDETFDYDPIGNLSAKNGATLQYYPNSPHRVSNTGGAFYAFDPNGSQIARSASGVPLQTYVYDRVGRLTSVTSDTSTTQFHYDHTDRRVSKTRPDGTTVRYWGRYAESRGGRLIKYYWAGDRMIASLDIPGVAYSEAPPGTPTPSPPWLPVLLLGVFGGVVLLIAWTPRGAEIRVGIAVAPARALATSSLLLLTSTPLLLAPQCGGGPELRHFHLDHLGSVIAKSNDVGAMVSQIRYSAYGEERGHFNAAGGGLMPNAADRHEWTGYEAEHEAGLAYAGARYYDPAIGQFLSHDPARQYASPYAYGPGDPVNGTDPSGMIFGFLKDFFKGIKNALGAASDAADRVISSSVSMDVRVGYTHRMGGATASQNGAGRANPGEAIVRGYAMYGVSSRYAVYATVVAMQNGGAAAGGPMIYGEDAFALADAAQAESVGAGVGDWEQLNGEQAQSLFEMAKSDLLEFGAISQQFADAVSYKHEFRVGIKGRADRSFSSWAEAMGYYLDPATVGKRGLVRGRSFGAASAEVYATALNPRVATPYAVDWGSPLRSLQATILHEYGHFIGMRHPTAYALPFAHFGIPFPRKAQ